VLDGVVLKRVQRILEIPELLGPLYRKRTALAAEKRKYDGLLQRRTVLVKSETLQDADYKAAANAPERQILIDAALWNDDDYSSLSERVDQLAVALDSVKAEIDLLDHERKALKAALEREYAEVIERLHADRILADVASSRKAPRGLA
jgi:hypothetical protein